KQAPLAARQAQGPDIDADQHLRVSLNVHVADVDTWTALARGTICASAAAGFRRARRGPVRPDVQRAKAQPNCRAAFVRGLLSMPSIDSLKTRQDLTVGRKKYAYYSLPAAEEAGLTGISRLPRSMK